MKKKSLLLAAISSLALGWGGVAHAQILTNGGFESDTTTTKNQNGFNSTNSPGWSNIGTAAGNSGVQYNGQPDLNEGTKNNPDTGAYFAFQDSDDSVPGGSYPGTNDGAYQITGTKVSAGDVLTLTWDAANSYQTPTQVVDILAAPSMSSAFSAASIMATSTSVPADALPASATPGNYSLYTLTVTVPMADNGDFVGVSFSTTGGTNSFANYDNFTLTDAVVPEPSSLALVLMGVGGLFLLNRVRRCLI